MQFILVYVVQRVDDGGVQILQSGTTEVTKGPINTYHSDNAKWTTSLDEYGATLQSSDVVAFQAQLGQNQAALLGGLAGQHKLFLLCAPPRQYPHPFIPTPLQEVRSLLMKPVRVGGRKGH